MKDSSEEDSEDDETKLSNLLARMKESQDWKLTENPQVVAFRINKINLYESPIFTVRKKLFI